ncbi:MAG: type II toxin-antitoxin system RelE/ParE family toxin [Treponema sp.]|nr:type II toxin-antitoxin system RelE/ParE family toxin [Treponema sp.]
MIVYGYGSKLYGWGQGDLTRWDKSIARLIIAWIEKHLINTQNPRVHGKGLSANLAGSWRYRIGGYRIIANIDDQTKTIVILDIDHRSRIYQK